MNIIEENFTTKKTKDKKILPKIILAIIILVIIAIIAIIATIAYIENSTLKVYVDGQIQTKLKDMFVFEEETTYVPIRDIASYLGYQSYNGDYAEKSEEKNKCYIQNENEIANFVLNSDKIYKLETTESKADYKYFYSKQPVKAINGKLYVSTDGMEKAFNVSYIYNEDKNRIDIYTMPYLINSYQSFVLGENYSKINQEFNNNKAIFDSRLVVEKGDSDKELGVIDLDGNVIIEPKYEDIQYIPETGDYFVTSDGKVGVISKNGERKVQILYDSLKLMDMDAGLYVAEREKKYGIIDVKGNVKVYVENDEIGIDIEKFEKNDIRSKYLLIDNLIPVRKDKLWGLVNKNGKQIVDFKYDSFGYVANNNKDALNLLLIPNYNVIVTCKDKKYGLINSAGEEIFPTRADDIYLSIESGKRYYYLNYNNKKNDVEDWLDSIGVKATVDNSQTTSTNKSTNETKNETKKQKNEDNEEE